jgi:hypothetical protein
MGGGDSVKPLAFALLVVGFLTVGPFPRDVQAQCSMCRTALEGSAEGRAMAEKFNLGILVLLGAPFSVVLAIGTALRYRRRLE